MSLSAQPTSNNKSSANKDGRLLHDFFEASAKSFPDRIALDIPPGTGRPLRRLVTYAELKQKSDSLAALLGPLITRDSVVAILLPRSEELYVSQLAVLKAGGAYTCIDPSFPDEQANEILRDSSAVALLTDKAGLSRHAGFPATGGRLFDAAQTIESTGSPAPAAPNNPEETASQSVTPGSLAYIIYTSGTTGRPKGVMIEHASISNLVGSDLEAFRLTPEDRVAQNSSPAYDSSLEELWLALAAGATAVVLDDETVRLGPDLVPWLKQEGITVFCPPPTLLRTTGCLDPESALPRLSLVYVGGEALPEDVAAKWGSGRRLVNGYGPTECTVTCMRERINPGDPITIGRPVAGVRAWVLDESLEEVADGEAGELCIGGAGLARGYRNRPELTAEKFPHHPVLGRIYRTGDLVHRDPDGRFYYHGRIDSQVKLRGYRVELEAIEARLSECEGVREAACRVQGTGAQQTLVAFVVPENGSRTLSFDRLKDALRAVLPAYMVPSRFAIISDLPTTVGGKLNRSALPVLEAAGSNGNGNANLPRNAMESRVEAAVRSVLRLAHPVSVDEDFFNDLGGDSLHAALLVSLLREDPATSSVTARDIYESRTVAELAKRVRPDYLTDPVSEEQTKTPGHPSLATGVQSSFLLILCILASSVAYLAVFEALPRLVDYFGLIPFVLLAPSILLAGWVLYAPLSVLAVALLKRLLIGRYRPMRAPVWGSFYIRNWIVQQSVRMVPWSLLEGTEFQLVALRAFGARIGKRVHIHRGVNLWQGGWDILEIGDDVSIGQDASLRLVDLDDGEVLVGAISLGDRSTLETRAGIGGNARVEEDAYLTALSSLSDDGCIPKGELWDGVPAISAGQAPRAPARGTTERIMSPFLHGIITGASRLLYINLLGIALVLPAAALLVFSQRAGVDWLLTPSFDGPWLSAVVLAAVLPVPLMLITAALISRALGEVRPGVISRWSLAWVRIWLKTQIVQFAGKWLAGALLWPVWLRLAGMKVARGAEISTIIDVVPELIEIGRKTFLADGIYLGGLRIHRGTVSIARTVLGENTFMGNHVVVPAGQTLPDNILLGICTVADDSLMRANTAWFGHPPFELPRREIVDYDRRLTHDPSSILYLNRAFWESLRFALPIVPLIAAAVWIRILSQARLELPASMMTLLVAPLATLAVVAFFCGLVLGLKWILLGRVQPGLHPFWSCWCNRWDFLYMAWEIYAREPLSFLEGTLLLSSYLRAMGARIGRRVVLGGGFAQVVDPDMLHFEDGATVSCQLQAHTFEDRVLKIDKVTIQRGATVGHSAVLLYGADVGIRTHVAPHSVVMKRESLLTGRSYAGCPTHPVQTNPTPAISMEAAS